VPVVASARWRGGRRTISPRRDQNKLVPALAEEKKKIDKARAMIEYHKCRVSSFSNWGKAASPEKLKHEAAVAALTAQIQLIELEASQRDPLF
jgi:hypothetical protein